MNFLSQFYHTETQKVKGQHTEFLEKEESVRNHQKAIAFLEELEITSSYEAFMESGFLINSFKQLLKESMKYFSQLTVREKIAKIENIKAYEVSSTTYDIEEQIFYEQRKDVINMFQRAYVSNIMEHDYEKLSIDSKLQVSNFVMKEINYNPLLKEIHEKLLLEKSIEKIVNQKSFAKV